MSKHSVVVNGITLTREQVEDALVALNTPEVPGVPCLTRVQRINRPEVQGVVIRGQVQEDYDRQRSGRTILTVVDAGGFGYSFSSVENLLTTWEVVK